ncbi:hypothetical protein J2X69_002945 [Algoriphagus sp. 4150]|uniref:hypothetical protein n=1 Tax=Algoriphagus sp. 4150 TaxID=2817756 RepID=UPI002860168E|nr:hypothetical protein [Algoriphagus sp. 4150]MDR7130589.1 hypothetical protein [Algoriphagus sp. 4150]
MKAIFFEKYGKPEEVLKLKELAMPIPKENEVLIKIHATAINDYDWSMVRDKPFLYRLLFGLLKPKHPIAKCFTFLEDRVFTHLSMTAEERYLHFFGYNKELFNQVPLQYYSLTFPLIE